MLDQDYPDTDLLLARISDLMSEHVENPSLALLHSVISESSKNSRLWKAAREGGVRETKDFTRVLNLPRRVWPEEEAKQLAEEMTIALKKPEGKLTLKPSQAIALLEIGLLGGLLGPLRAGAGKAQPNTEPVLTPDGWVPMGNLKLGDRVVGSDGLPHTVIGVYPQGVRPIYRVTFTDGSYTLCDERHLWSFKGCHGETYTQPLYEWMKRPLKVKSGNWNRHTLYAPLVKPIERPEQTLPLDPYTLGAILGDGCVTQGSPSFTSMDLDIISTLKLPEGVSARALASKSAGRATQYGLTQGEGYRAGPRKHYLDGPNKNPLTEIFKGLGLWGHDAYGKFIPEQYKGGSVQQRLAVLQGLFDTDGYHTKASVEHCTVSERLANDVRDLVQSLGGTAQRISTQSHAYRTLCKLPNHLEPFKCKRKLSAFKQYVVKRQREPYRAVKSIDRVDDAEATCIEVDAPDHLYVTRDHILTHNTLVTFLAPTVRFSQRPLLIVPAKLLEKTKRELKEYLVHFRCAYHLHIISYESLSRVSHATYLETLQPDLVILDEAHKAKNTKAAVTRRIKRYVEQAKCPVVALSGTVTKRSLFDYWHLAKWALGDKAPLPLHFPELEDWANALDERPRASFRTPPGALVKFAESEDLEAIREGFARRIVETPGVVATNDKLVGCSLTVSRLGVDVSPEVEEAFVTLRSTWTAPDGWEIFDAMQLAQKARQIGLGFCYELVEWPPKPWLDARRAWGKFVRDTLKGNRRGLDSELQVAQACARGWLDDKAYREWREIRDTFVPVKKTRWLSDFALKACETWLEENREGSLIWCEHIEFAEELSRRTGLPYCGAGGVDKDGRTVESYAGAPVILSIQSSGEGRNLQAWYRSLVISPPSSGLAWEQTLARTHRDFQDREEVTYDVLVTCAEHEGAFMQALNDAEYRTSTTLQPDRLTYCDLLWPTLTSRKPATSYVDSSLIAWNK